MRAKAIRWSVGCIAGATIVLVAAWRLHDGPSGRGTGSAPTVADDANPFLPPGAADLGWPGVRGPGHDGHSPEIHLADRWPDEGPPVLWTKELGQGYSGLAAVQGRVFTQYQTVAGQYLLCLDAASGETLWQHRYDWPFDPTGLYPGPRATPTVADGRVYFESPVGLVGCFTVNGTEQWAVNLKEKYGGQGTDFGCACSPTVVDGKVFMPVGGKDASMVALDARSGDVLWAEGDDPASYTPALPITVDGRRQIVGYMMHCLAGFDAASGELLWREALSHGYDEHAAWPVYREPHLWISAPFRAGCQMFELTGGDAPDCRFLWHRDLLSNDVASSVLVDGFLYGFDLQDVQTKAQRPSRGTFRCVEFATGEPRWDDGDPKARRTANDGRIGHATVLAADGKLFLLSDTGQLILARVNPERYEELGRADVLGGSLCWTAPSLDRGRLFLRSPERAVCLYVGEPDRLTKGTVTQSIDEAGTRRGAVRDLSGLLGVEPEFAMDAPTRRWLIRWFEFSFGILAVAAVGALVPYWLSRGRMPWRWSRRIFLSTAFLLGLVGTTPLSLLCDDFVFTWQVCLFVAFQVALYQVRLSRKGRPAEDAPALAALGQDRSEARSVESANCPSPGPEKPHDEPGAKLAARLSLVGFVATCLAYFFLCRRLGLPTEWVFLTGFVGAVPLGLAAGWLARRSHARPVLEIACVVLAYACFYAASLPLLFLKYEILP